MNFSITVGVSLTLLLAFAESSSGCPDKCTCNSIRKQVRCIGLDKVPTNIPLDTDLFMSTQETFDVVDSNDFDYLPNLEEIHVDSANEVHLKSSIPKLKLLRIKNFNGETLDSQDYTGVPNIEQIQFDQSKINNIKITKGLLTKLVWLELVNAQMTSLDLSLFNSLPNLTAVFLQRGKLRRVYASVKTAGTIRIMDLEDNPLECDCKWLKCLSSISRVMGTCTHANSGKVSTFYGEKQLSCAVNDEQQ